MIKPFTLKLESGPITREELTSQMALATLDKLDELITASNEQATTIASLQAALSRTDEQIIQLQEELMEYADE
jgi:hypothetical protein